MIIEHLPYFMQEIEELKKLFYIEENIFSDVKKAYEKYENNLWIETADEYGIARREKFLGIVKPQGDIEERRKVVLSEWSTVLPFNYKSLNDWLLRYLGEHNYTINIDFENYIVNILLSLSVKEYKSYLQKTLREKIPANMIIEIDIDYNRYRDFKKFTYGQLKEMNITLGEMKSSVLA